MLTFTRPLLAVCLTWTLLLTSVSAQTPVPAASQSSSASQPVAPGSVLEEGTPVKLRMGRTVSSADARVGDTVDLEVLEEVRVGNVVVVQKGAMAIATVTTAQTKKSMGRGGKIDINIDYVKLVDGEKAALRAVKDMKGGGHQGAMTGAMVATSLVFFPAAPLFLFIHGKDISIPKGTEVTAYVNGNMTLDLAKFDSGLTPGSAPAASIASSAVGTLLDISSTPDGADISIDGNFVGSTPSEVSVANGDHIISLKLAGYTAWERTLKTSGGKVKISAPLSKTDSSQPSSNLTTTSDPVADAARAARAKQQRPTQQ
jgi:PEGA domain-containing protein